MIQNRQRATLYVMEFLYVLLAASSFYLLALSRTGEASTVWQTLHPFFIPVLFSAIFVLITILFRSDDTTLKLLFTIVLSLLLHSFFSVIFPAGDLSGQQMVLGKTRRVFDNTILHGWSGLPTQSVQIIIYEMFQGINLQAALSTIFARMLSLDVFYIHLFLVPVLWGIFVPIASFLVAETLSGNKKTAVLASLIVSAFPYTIYFGAISVPNSLGFIFFFFSLYFMLEYLFSNVPKNAYLMILFSFFSFLAHYITGIMAFSLLFLAIAFRTYSNEKGVNPSVASVSLVSAFLVSVSILPFSFVFLRFLGTSTNTFFTLDKFLELPLGEIVGLFLIGKLTYGFDPLLVLLNIVGPLLALVSMIYLIFRTRHKRNKKYRGKILFLFIAFLIILIDYRILELFMEGLPINAERLWVLRDFIAVPFVAVAIYVAFSYLEARKPKLSLKTLMKVSRTNSKSSKGKRLNALGFFLSINVLIPIIIGGWITLSLTAAYPQVAPLQTTSYELDAVRYIARNTNEKYVVIGDVWTIYAGGMIVGINNPEAYYFSESNKTGHDLFVNMVDDPSPQWMLAAMNYTNTTISYFVISEPRLGADEFHNVVLRVFRGNELSFVRIFGDGKLYLFSYRKE
jgi:hypothetical protein